MTLFFKRFSELCKEHNTSPNGVAKKLLISSGSITAWKRGAYPRSETLQKLAKYFHVSADYLIGNVNEPEFYLDNDRILREINSYGDEEDAPTTESERAINKSGEQRRSKLRSIARLEESQITPEQDKEIANYIDYLLSKKNDE